MVKIELRRAVGMELRLKWRTPLYEAEPALLKNTRGTW